MKIAYGGIPGSVSYAAAQSYFGAKDSYQGFKTYQELFTAVAEGKVDAGVVPVENSLSGTIYEHYDLLNESDVHAVGELYQKIEHHLMAKASKGSGDRLKELKKVYSRPDALEQCEKFLNRHPWLEQIAATDVSTAAELVKNDNDDTAAAISNTASAELYGLQVVRKNIEDNQYNYTRFLVISKKPKSRIDCNKASLVFVVSHEPGSLYNAISVFENYELNLTKIESRPVYGKPYEYIFYVDFEYGKDHKLRMDEIVAVYQENTQYLKVLGYYQSAKKPV